MNPQPRLTAAILRVAHKLPEGASISAKELLHLGERAAVDQALSRLARRGELMRVGRGVYVAPVRGPFGFRAPSPAKLAKGLARAGETVAHQGAEAANRLGLTTQVPLREVFWTSGPSRVVAAGGAKVELRHVPTWQLVLPGRPGGEVVRAMAWLGPERAGEAVHRARERLTLREIDEVLAVRSQLPTWAARAVSSLATRA